jgi:hypothetical protein
MVGRRSALSRPDLRFDAPSPGADRDAGRHDVPLRHRRDRGGAAAGADKDVKIGGGVETVRQYVRAGQVDEIHLALSPVLLGRGEALFAGIDLRALGYRTVEHVPTPSATHIVLARQDSPREA